MGPSLSQPSPGVTVVTFVGNPVSNGLGPKVENPTLLLVLGAPLIVNWRNAENLEVSSSPKFTNEPSALGTATRPFPSGGRPTPGSAKQPAGFGTFDQVRRESCERH